MKRKENKTLTIRIDEKSLDIIDKAVSKENRKRRGRKKMTRSEYIRSLAVKNAKRKIQGENKKSTE